MPSTHDIPSRREHHCEPCAHHKCFNAFYGSDRSWKDYVCTHPDAYHDLLPLSDEQKTRDLQIQIRTRLMEHGRGIGRTELQPPWCPLKRKAQE